MDFAALWSSLPDYAHSGVFIVAVTLVLVPTLL